MRQTIPPLLSYEISLLLNAIIMKNSNDYSLKKNNSFLFSFFFSQTEHLAKLSRSRRLRLFSRSRSQKPCTKEHVNKDRSLIIGCLVSYLHAPLIGTLTDITYFRSSHQRVCHYRSEWTTGEGASCRLAFVVMRSNVRSSRCCL